MEVFEELYKLCKHPLIYNGDVTSVDDIRKLEEMYPKLAGVMIGRGLLARPSLALEYASGVELSWEKRRSLLLDFHDRMKAHYETTANSETQVHSRLRLFWEYMAEELGRKTYKKIMKAGNPKNYLSAVSEI